MIGHSGTLDLNLHMQPPLIIQPRAILRGLINDFLIRVRDRPNNIRSVPRVVAYIIDTKLLGNVGHLAVLPAITISAGSVYGALYVSYAYQMRMLPSPL